MLRKFDINSLHICPPHLYTVVTLPWETQKSHFSTGLFIHTSEYLCYLKRKQTVTLLPTTPKKRHKVSQTKHDRLTSVCLVPEFDRVLYSY